MDLHPYDGVERRFRYTDVQPGYGPEALARVLRLSRPPSGEVLYDLSFFSGGIGIIDHLSASLLATPELWAEVVAGLEAQSLEEAANNTEWAAELGWLLTAAEGPTLLRPAAAAFIAQHRQDFQPLCHPGDRILFECASDVNHWGVLWGDDTRINFLGYDQG
ncbi:hypothetical protein GobsT_44520 [Gemmata obscuriglobus]|uniref:Uncharacterized protein n=1 Tax=Gemmata obscuriglobus TaxID=114 RepID=A0A2Z3H915_9BACT|nr:hypothetical protein [Gemmata obscuriglobus]AWM37560.1 hypothetical protein C1280_11430 [Gemmata obscuriglobus]QEG29654.1 hypothetical protein GobsT_44520 [Gemmata obscuriglobus]VTS08971.1 Uncharacterized protein OS=Shewanella sp. (strain MR-7) GN=Shewmr7_0427 PE=4 SV=1 [Gemmata obscuriglobus UQM 2246]